MNISKIIECPNICIDFFEKKEKNIPFVLYGAGGGGLQAIDEFRLKGISPVAICDSNPKKWGLILKDIEVMPLEKVQENYEDFYIFISSPIYACEIINCLKMKIPENRIIFFKFDTNPDVVNYKKFLHLNRDKLELVYNLLSDEKSKFTMENMLFAWSSCNYEYFKAVFTPNQYFIDEIITLTEDEVFLDVGAYTGDTAKGFIAACNNQYSKIYAVEPNPFCLAELNELKSQYHDFEIVERGAFDKKCTIGFDNATGNPSQAKVNFDAIYHTLIKVDCIDAIINDKVTFIKMDIEGAELEALKGAVKTIISHRPKLAICVYHKATDIVEIPLFLESLNLSYKYYLRHHSHYSGETVLYAV